MADTAHGFEGGDKVWVEDGDGKHHPGVFTPREARATSIHGEGRR